MASEPTAGTASERVVLTGFMATGKSTVARLLAQRLGWDACDTDELIVSQHGPIEKIFAEQGEEGFRAIEHKIVQELAPQLRLVISTGGGLLLDKKNVELLVGRVFCLTAKPNEILRRLQQMASQQAGSQQMGSQQTEAPVRPLLDAHNATEQELLQRITELLAARSDSYEAFEQVPTDGLTAAQVAEEIHDRLLASQASGS